MSIVVLDNFLDKDYFKKIQSIVLGSGIDKSPEAGGKYFTWFMAPVITSESTDHQMAHVVYHDHTIFSDFFNVNIFV